MDFTWHSDILQFLKSPAVEHSLLYSSVGHLSFGWLSKHCTAQWIHHKCISLSFAGPHWWLFRYPHCSATGGSLVLSTSEAMLRSLCFTPVHLTEKIIVWLIHLTQLPFISFSGLCFTGASNQCLALRSPQSSSLSCVTVLFFCSIVLIPVAAPLTPCPVFSSLIFLSSVCTVSQANCFTWDSSPDVAFSFQITSQDEILSIWLQIQPKFN